MPHYVLVEVDDNATTKGLIEKLNGRYGLTEHPDRKFRVIGVWGKPSKFCECTSADKGDKPFARGAKSGWWVHITCGRPTRAWGESRRHWASALGRNLLPGNTDYMPQGWGIQRKGDVEPVPTGQATPPTGDGVAAKRSARRALRKRH